MHARTENPFLTNGWAGAIIGVLLFTGIGFYAKAENVSDETFYRNKGYTLLAGEQKGELVPGTYLVIASIEVPEGSSLAIESGTLLTFMRDAGITVRGTLTVRGSRQAMVNFSALDPGKYRVPLAANDPAAWKGISTSGKGRVDLQYTVISGAANAIIVSSTDAKVRCDNVKFSENGTDVIMPGGPVDVPKGVFCSLDLNGGDMVASLLSAKEARERVRNDSLKNSPRDDHGTSDRKSALRLGFSVAGGISAAAAITGFIVNTVYYDKYKSASDPNSTSAAQVESWKRNAIIGKTAGITASVLSAVCVSGIVMTFCF